MAGVFAAASTLFGKSSTLSAYTLHSGPSPSSSSTNLTAGVTTGIGSGRTSPAAGAAAAAAARRRPTKPFHVGLWKVIGATHKTTGKDVSVWVFEKRVLDGVRNGRDWVLEQLKKEATSLSRLRHPDILHMVEPLEETRSELTFVTEMVTASLGNILAAAKSGKPRAGAGAGHDGEVDLDEVEIQKGTLQVAKGLAFLHTQAKSVHLNLSPDAILVNAKGDWKLSGLSQTTPLTQPDGGQTQAQYAEVDTRLPPQVQWKLDYLAPEYALDSQLSPANDLYSLGCVLYAVHMGGRPPFVNRGSMQSLRENAEGPLGRREYARGPRWERCSSELKDLLPRLLTRTAGGRISLASLSSHPFFSSLAISTLNFLDPATFASKPREEKATFLRGLVRVLPNFSERLKRGKILLSLLEEMKDTYLLPFLLPNVFEIAKGLTKDEFVASVLPKLQPLFALKDPPQNMLTLLDNLTLFEEKTAPAVFRENVMPLIYNSLESEHLPVQERVLKAVPHLCEVLDYGTVQNVLLVKVAILFTRTRILSVKVQTLECFHAMVSTLDATTLTTKLVPLLAKIKTKEPAVMMATLSVQEAMGAKVGLEAIATLVLPQLWSMSMGPLLNADQFGRFMAVIKTLGTRVEREHSQHLREVRKMEETTQPANGDSFTFNPTGEVDFESLVKGGGATSTTNAAASSSTPDPWNMDDWGTPSTEPADPLASFGLSLGSALGPARSRSPLGSTTQAGRSSSFSALQPRSSSSFPALQPTSSSTSISSFPALNPSSGFPALKPTSPPRSPPQSGPNYNISLPSRAPAPQSPPKLSPRSPSGGMGMGSGMGSGMSGGMISMGGMGGMSGMSGMSSGGMSSMGGLGGMSGGYGSSTGLGSGMGSTLPPLSAAPAAPKPMAPMAPSLPKATPQPPRPPPGYASGVMQPTSAPKPAWNAANAATADWGDFDPLK